MLYIKDKHTQCGELTFLENFLQSGFIEGVNRTPEYEVSIIQEPYTSFGYADLVCVVWDKSIQKRWNPKRNQLDINDIKILHHLYSCNLFKDIDELVCDLGFSKNKIRSSLERLSFAEMIELDDCNKAKINPINEIFFVKEIITIEAKLHDWKRALEQSVNNTSFSSRSYTLFPPKAITKNLIKTYSQTDVGIITFEEKYKILKDSKKKRIPANLNSWLFNEHIGRRICPQV